MSVSSRTKRMLDRAYALSGDDRATQSLYRDWASSYDESLMTDLGYQSPLHIARLVSKFVPNKTSHILDLGCGTGLGGRFINEAGYFNVWGLDYSLDMLRQASDTAAYRQLILADLNQPLPLATACVDAMTCLGTFTHGHVGPECMPELCRALKPGGRLLCSIHKAVWAEGFEQAIGKLKARGISKTLVQEEHRLFRRDAEPTAWYLVFERLPLS